MADKNSQKAIKDAVISEAIRYSRAVHGTPRTFVSGDRIPYAGRVFGEEEVANLVEASLDFWLTAGPWAERFEKELATLLGVRHCSLVNSGSSANLIAFAALTAPELGERRVLPGDEVITVACGFPTTVTPIIQHGAIPVFVDVSLPSCNIDTTRLEEALSPRTKAVILAHTLGHPFDVEAVGGFCNKHGLLLVEDNCDSLGSKVLVQGTWRYTGTIGEIGTSSFYPPHHITMGEGGAVYTNDPVLCKVAESFRDWGRDCWCPSGQDNTCGHRFDKSYGQLPLGYDHKYVYARFGYNLKATDLQAAIGCAQLKRFPGFVAARKANWRRLRDGLTGLEDRLILPDVAPGTDPSWFGFLLTVREGAGFTRDEIVTHLESKGIQTRMLFAGNIIRHPCFDEMRATGKGYRVVGELAVTDRVVRDTFWLGVYPGLTENMLAYMIDRIREAVR